MTCEAAPMIRTRDLHPAFQSQIHLQASRIDSVSLQQQERLSRGPPTQSVGNVDAPGSEVGNACLFCCPENESFAGLYAAAAAGAAVPFSSEFSCVFCPQ